MGMREVPSVPPTAGTNSHRHWRSEVVWSVTLPYSWRYSALFKDSRSRQLGSPRAQLRVCDAESLSRPGADLGSFGLSAKHKNQLPPISSAI
jgi:hypothetical protein